MLYSEKTQKELDKYTKRLVRCQPVWLRKLFKEELVYFVIDDIDGGLALAINKNIDQKTADLTTKLVSKFMGNNPSPVIGAIVQ